MKKFGVLILIIVVGVVVYMTRDTSVPGLGIDRPQSGNFQPDPSNATLIFDDGAVTLSQGKGEKEFEEITLLEEIAYGDINNDKKDDAVTFVARSGGGSGTFIYVAAYVSGPINYKGTNAVFLGDRISPQKISINDDFIIVEYFDRREEESFASEPTILISRQFFFKNGVLEERGG